MKNKFIILTLLFALPRFAPGAALAQEYKQVKAIIGVHSNISNARHSLKELAQLARDKGMEVIILTDHLLARAEYGIWPLPNLTKKVVEEDSILRFGIANYLRLIQECNRNLKDLLVIPGCYISPFYYYKGNPFSEKMLVYNFSKQMLVMGLKKADDYRNLPVASNAYKDKKWGLSSIILFLPALLILLGIYLMRKPSFCYQDDYGRKFFGPTSAFCRFLGIIILIIGALFFMNNFPFNIRDEFGPCQGNKGIAPYQKVIDYVAERKGLIFWSAPEAEVAREKRGYITLVTERNPDELVKATGYSGFSAIYGGERSIQEPGREWDKILKAYCQGKRATPAWAIGEAVYKEGPIDAVQTIILAPKLAEEELLDALSKGRMYALGKPQGAILALDEFSLTDSGSGKTALMGEKLVTRGRILITIRISFKTPVQGGMRVRLIKNGELLKTWEAEDLLFSSTLEDDPSPQGISYYRLIVAVPGGEIVSNPIFAE